MTIKILASNTVRANRNIYIYMDPGPFLERYQFELVPIMANGMRRPQLDPVKVKVAR